MNYKRKLVLKTANPEKDKQQNKIYYKTMVNKRSEEEKQRYEAKRTMIGRKIMKPGVGRWLSIARGYMVCPNKSTS